MMESSSEKKKLFYMIVLILTFITMIIGATIAYFSLISSQQDEGTTIYTGKLEINYIDGVYIRNPELMPIKTITYNTTDKVYRNRFSVASSGTLDQTIGIDMTITRNEFANNALKYIIYNSKGEEMSSGFVPQTGNVTLANNMYLAHNGAAQYTLIIWLYNENYNQNDEMGNIVTGRINIYSTQLKK